MDIIGAETFRRIKLHQRRITTKYWMGGQRRQGRRKKVDIVKEVRGQEGDRAMSKRRLSSQGSREPGARGRRNRGHRHTKASNLHISGGAIETQERDLWSQGQI